MSFRNLACVLVFAIPSVHAQNIPFTYPLAPDTASVKMILKYGLGYSVQQEIETMQKMINNKAWAEFHIGGGILVSQYFANEKLAVLGIKVSPIDPKLPFANNVKAKAFKIRRMAEIMGDSLSGQNAQLLNEIDQLLANYDKSKWRRFSVMLNFPFHLSTYDTSYYYSPVDSAYHTQIHKISEPEFLKQITLSLGYDLGDVGTVSVGGTISEKPAFLVMFSFDVSTPTYAALASFVMHLKSFAYPRLPAYPYYGNE